MTQKNIHLFLKVVAIALVIPALLPTQFLGARLDYATISFVQEIKGAEESREAASPISDRSGQEDRGGREERVGEKRDLGTNENREGVDGDAENDREDARSSRASHSSRNNRSVTEVLGRSVVNNEGGAGSGRVTVEVHKFLDDRPALSQGATDSFPMIMESDGTETSYNISTSTNYISTFNVKSGSDVTTYEVLHSRDSSSVVFGPQEGCRAIVCPADLNHDGEINGFDVSILVDNWGAIQPEEGAPLLGDINEDGLVDGADLGMILADWGVCNKAAYQLNGYSWGDTLESALSAEIHEDAAILENITEDQVIVVWNSSCVSDVAPVCDPNVNLIKNGGFEDIRVEDEAGWDIFDTNDGIKWVVAWMNGVSETFADVSRPNPALLEIQAGVYGWTSKEGTQHAELDSDWVGPNGSLNGEPASIKIYQDVVTVPGLEYEFSFAYSPRPGTGQDENYIKVERNDSEIFSNSLPSTTENTQWNVFAQTFIADSMTTRFSFSDISGNPNSLGVFLDDVRLRCLPERTDGDEYGVGNGSEHDDSDDSEEGSVSGADSSGGSGGGSGGGGGNNNNNDDDSAVLGASTINMNSLPEVLGAMTCSDPYLDEYIKFGAENNPQEVEKLQMFLNKFQGANLPVTGYYGPQTREAVNNFQLFHNMFVLAPWVQAGLMADDKTPTGYVYKTTKRWINLLECPVLKLPMPSLP